MVTGCVPVGPRGLRSRPAVLWPEPRKWPLHPAPMAPDEACVNDGPQLSRFVAICGKGCCAVSRVSSSLSSLQEAFPLRGTGPIRKIQVSGSSRHPTPPARVSGAQEGADKGETLFLSRTEPREAFNLLSQPQKDS